MVVGEIVGCYHQCHRHSPIYFPAYPTNHCVYPHLARLQSRPPPHKLYTPFLYKMLPEQHTPHTQPTTVYTPILQGYTPGQATAMQCAYVIHLTAQTATLHYIYRWWRRENFPQNIIYPLSCHLVMNKREAFLLDTRINVLALTIVFKPQSMC